MSLISMITVLSTILLVNESLKHTLLKMQSSALETSTFVTENPSLVFSWQSLSHQIAYVPHGQSLPRTFPTFFSNLHLTDMAKVDVGDQTYLLNKQISDTGTLYIARNIAAFEK